MKYSAVFLCLLLSACGSKPSAPPELPRISVKTTVVSLQPHTADEVLPGSVKATTMVSLQSRIPAMITSINATSGTSVAKDVLLVELEANEITARRNQAQAQAEQAASDLERMKSLFSKQIASKADLEQVESRAKASAAALQEAEIMMSYTRISAPFAGLVLRRHAEVGDLVAPGRPILDLEDPKTLRFEVEIPESLAHYAALGNSMQVQIPQAKLDQSLTISEVVPTADPISRSVLVKLALPTHSALRSGQFGRASLSVSGATMVQIPSSAVLERGQLNAVFVSESGQARLRLVRLGSTSATQTWIRAGLSPGEQIILNPGTISDGQAIVQKD